MKRAIRDQLEALSLRQYGIKSAWRKVQKLPGYQIPTGLKPAPKPKERYVEVQHKNNRKTIYKESTAVEQLNFKPQPPPQQQKSVIAYREPTADELIFMMERAWQDQVVAEILRNPVEPHHPTFALAYLYKYDRLSWEVRLHKSQDSEEYNKAVDELLAKVDKKDADKFNSWLLKPDANTEGAIDYEDFLNELTQIDEKSDLMFNEMFAAAEAKMPDAAAKRNQGVMFI